jgi:hypothetical protein
LPSGSSSVFVMSGFAQVTLYRPVWLIALPYAGGSRSCGGSALREPATRSAAKRARACALACSRAGASVGRAPRAHADRRPMARRGAPCLSAGLAVAVTAATGSARTVRVARCTDHVGSAAGGAPGLPEQDLFGGLISPQGRAAATLGMPERQHVDAVRTGPVVEPVPDTREQKSSDTTKSGIRRGSADSRLNADERDGVSDITLERRSEGHGSLCRDGVLCLGAKLARGAQPSRPAPVGTGCA